MQKLIFQQELSHNNHFSIKKMEKKKINFFYIFFKKDFFLVYFCFVVPYGIFAFNHWQCYFVYIYFTNLRIVMITVICLMIATMVDVFKAVLPCEETIVLICINETVFFTKRQGLFLSLTFSQFPLTKFLLFHFSL